MAPIVELLQEAGKNVERYVLEPTKTQITDAILRRQTTSGAVTTVTVTQTATSGGGGGGGGGGGNNLSGGAIAGIVIGSIVGVLLLIWIIRSCSNMGAPPVQGENPTGRAWYDGVEAEPYPPRRSQSRRRSHSRRPSVREVREVREYATAVPVLAPPPPTYVYETDVRKARRGRSRDHRSRSASRY